jgi:serine/threonine protein kinase
MTTRSRTEESIFAEALEKASPEGRADFLAIACGSDDGLRARVEKLLKSHDEAGSFLRRPLTATVDEPPLTEGPGTVIGPYKLMEKIGEGGMGLVFVAEQQEPVRRKVALKVIKPGLDSRDVVARFEAERQALALMDHPHIARVFDAGTTGSGRPYFVMELVKGVPITDYCDQNQLTPGERLQLFVHVCQAVQHAHTKGVLHRDIKPSNVLVTLHDGTPVVKVIDFGVAKAIGQQLTDKTIYTRFAQMIGTPLYMSPEQAQMSGLDIDTRSDVYSLGVLLYELLTGTTPFDGERLKQAAFDEMRRIIREEEPLKPSTRLSTLGETLSAVSAKRKTEPRLLTALVRGDLDWIVMKALDKDRGRRYETASAFAADVGRFLKEEPVEARPPSSWYRLHKLARRNKAALTTAALVAAALVLGTAMSTWQAVRATEAESAAHAAEDDARTDRDRALEAEKRAKEAADQARTDRDRALAAEKRAQEAADKARAEAATAKGALAFILEDMFRALGPRPGDQSQPVTLQSVMDEAARRIAKRKFEDPLEEAVIRGIISDGYRRSGDHAKALPHMERAYQLRVAKLGENHPDNAVTSIKLGVAYRNVGKDDRALPLFLKGIELSKAAGPQGRRPVELEGRYSIPQLMGALAYIYQHKGKKAEAKQLYDRLGALYEEWNESNRAATERRLMGDVWEVANPGDPKEVAEPGVPK